MCMCMPSCAALAASTHRLTPTRDPCRTHPQGRLLVPGGSVQVYEELKLDDLPVGESRAPRVLAADGRVCMPTFILCGS